MDGIVVLLIIIGFISRMSKKKKKQAVGKKAKAEAFVPPAAPAKPRPAPARKPAQMKIPFSKEEWAAFLEDGASILTPPPKKPSPEGQTERGKALGEGMSPALQSTQGESEAEHRKHLEKMQATEAQKRERTETRRSQRSANRQKLREAVIMSEVLGKPVALRPRGQR